MAKEWKDVAEFYDVMSRLRSCRLTIVSNLLELNKSDAAIVESLNCLRWVEEKIKSSRTVPGYVITLTSDNGRKIRLNVQDEIYGIEKDIDFVQSVMANNVTGFVNSLAAYHPVSRKAFFDEVDTLEEMLSAMLQRGLEMLITDWDGTMKTYCCNYRTSVQPAYSAYWLAIFAKHCSKLTAVLTAGPLRDFGILDLIAVPVEKTNVIFGGSWGREWLIDNRRRVDNGSLPKDSEEHLNRLTSSLLNEINRHPRFHRFLMTGSGFQRKVDRVTIGLQTVTGDVGEQEMADFLANIHQTVKGVDPDDQFFLIRREKLDIEFVVKAPTQRSAWSKADGVGLLLRETGKSLAATSGSVWICGDTESDLPMLEFSLANNATSTFATFVNPNDEVRRKVSSLINDTDRYRFVGCPEVIHASIERVLRKRGIKTI